MRQHDWLHFKKNYFAPPPLLYVTLSPFNVCFLLCICELEALPANADDEEVAVQVEKSNDAF